MAKRHPKIDGGFILIPRNTIKCNQYKALRSHTKNVYAAILTEFIRDKKINPMNEVTITHNQMEAISAVSHGSVVRGVKELKTSGFMRTLIPGGLEGNPSTFQLNGRYTDSGLPEAYW